MAKEEKSDKIEREYIIPLREKCRPAPRYKKTNKAIKSIKEFLARHMKIRDRDLNKIKLDKYVNEFVWSRGIKHPPSKIKVKAIKEGDIVKVELAEMPDKLKFKKLREEKLEKKAQETVGKKKTAEVEKKTEEKVEDAKSKEEKAEEKEKKTSLVEAGNQIEKAIAKKSKHDFGGKTKQPKHAFRQALDK